MKGWRNGVVAMVAIAATTAPLSAQSRGAVGRTLDRLGRTIERVMENVGDAMDRGEDSALSRSAEDFSWSGRIAAGGSLEIKGVNGDIVVERTSGSEVEITATARARKSDPNSVVIDLVEHDGGLTFCAVYPTPRGADEDNWCGAGSRGRMNTRNNDVEVRFVIRLPDGVPFTGRTVNGDVEALGLESDVELETVNGDVDVGTTGFVEAATVNGSIHADMDDVADVAGGIFETVNGSITLDVPDDVDADVDASWVNGSLDSDIPLTVRGRISRHSARGALGDGGPQLALKTVNGSIRIR